MILDTVLPFESPSTAPFSFLLLIPSDLTTALSGSPCSYLSVLPFFFSSSSFSSPLFIFPHLRSLPIAHPCPSPSFLSTPLSHCYSISPLPLPPFSSPFPLFILSLTIPSNALLQSSSHCPSPYSYLNPPPPSFAFPYPSSLPSLYPHCQTSFPSSYSPLPVNHHPPFPFSHQLCPCPSFIAILFHCPLSSLPVPQSLSSLMFILYFPFCPSLIHLLPQPLLFLLLPVYLLSYPPSPSFPHTLPFIPLLSP